MKIISFSYFDKVRNWGFENLEFLKLTLLVGASGVGKTQILRAIQNLKELANGTSLNGIRWEVTFESSEGKMYNWKGEFEIKESSLLDITKESEKSPIIISEQLTENGEEIVQRDKNRIVFWGKETVKLAPHQSAIYLLKAENKINTAAKGAEKIKILDTPAPNFSIYLDTKSVRLLIAPAEKSATYLQMLLDSPLSTNMKLLIVSKLANNPLFQSIKSRYMEIFPQVKDIRFVNRKEYGNISEEHTIQIKEKSVDQWISQENMSSGMLRSLMQISELYLCPEGSVLLMDEFENSLGINCIDELTNDILSSQRNIQFILTSHHPYIINNIPYQNWKIVTRKAGKVIIKNASDYRIGESKHDYFMQLLQLEDFNNGVD